MLGEVEEWDELGGEGHTVGGDEGVGVGGADNAVKKMKSKKEGGDGGIWEAVVVAGRKEVEGGVLGLREFEEEGVFHL
jgi:hypothetical protein